MKKKQVLIIINWIIVGFVVLVCAVLLTLCLLIKNRDNNIKKAIDEAKIVKPNVVDFFACSDYCPLEDSAYMLKIYEGVTDPDVCTSLKGEYRIIYGWTETKICVVK
jgi:hypothetical protein